MAPSFSVRLLAPIALLPVLVFAGEGEPARAPVDEGTKARPVRFALTGEEECRAIAFSPDGKWLAAVSDCQIYLWDRATGRQTSQVLQVDEDAPTVGINVIFAPGSQRLATLERAGRRKLSPIHITLWDLDENQRLRRFRSLATTLPGSYFAHVWRAGFSPDGKMLAAGTEWGTVAVWDTATGKEKVHFHGGVAAGFSPDGRTLLSISSSGQVHRWQAGTNKLVESCPRSEYIHAVEVVFAPDGTQIAVGDGSTVVLLDAATGRTRRRLETAGQATPLTFSPDSKLLAVYREGRISFHDTARGTERSWIRHGKRVAFAPAGDMAAVFDGRVITLEDTDSLLLRGAKAAPPAAEPAGGPLQAELIATKDTYALDHRGLSIEEYIELADREHVQTPKVDLVLRLKNTSDRDIKLGRWKGKLYHPSFHLVGPGALNFEYLMASTGLNVGGDDEPPDPGPLVLKAGATYALPITKLDDAEPFRRSSSSYWVLPGTYRLYGRCAVEVSPPPKGARVNDEGFGWVELPLGPVALKVLPARPASVDPLERPEDVPVLGSLAPPPEDEYVSMLKKKLASVITLDKGIPGRTQLRQAVSFFSDWYDFDLEFDKAAFQRAGRQPLEKALVQFDPVSRVPIDIVLNMLLDPLDAGIEVRTDGVWIVPLDGQKSIAERIPRSDKRYRDAIRQGNYTVAEGIPPGTPLPEALKYLGDHLDFTILLDRTAFARASMKDVAERQVELPRGTTGSRATILHDLLEAQGATFVVRDDVVLVVPASK